MIRCERSFVSRKLTWSLGGTLCVQGYSKRRLKQLLGRVNQRTVNHRRLSDRSGTSPEHPFAHSLCSHFTSSALPALYFSFSGSSIQWNLTVLWYETRFYLTRSATKGTNASDIRSKERTLLAEHR